MSSLLTIFAFCLFCSFSNAVTNVIVEVESRGYKFSVKDDGQINSVQFQAGINELTAVDSHKYVSSMSARGYYSYVVNSPVNEGDKVYYNVLINLKNGRKEELLRREFTHHAAGKVQTHCQVYPCLIFEDNFNRLDFSKWQHEVTAGGGGNNEFQFYTNNRSNSYVRDGHLYIKPTLTVNSKSDGNDWYLKYGSLNLWGSCTDNQWSGCEKRGSESTYLPPIQSAKLITKQTFGMRYGRVEIRAKLPRGDWLWPAIWMMPTENAYSTWPASGEIDIVESRGNQDFKAWGASQGNNKMGSTLHWGTDARNNRYERTHKSFYAKSGTFASKFHTYRMDWTKNGLYFYVDNEFFVSYTPPNGGFWDWGEFYRKRLENPWAGRPKMAPFDQKFYFILNVAVGGTAYFPDGGVNAGYQKPWSNGKAQTANKDFWNARSKWLPTWGEAGNEQSAMVIDYVRAWKMTPEDDIPIEDNV